MLPEDSAARVQPLRRTKKPGYPGHDDPDPTQHPTPIPYPFSSRLIAAVGSLGLVAAMQTATAEDADPEVETPLLRNGQVEDKDGNPLGLADIGMPYRSGGYGTGAPEQLSEVLAREAIERVFAERGYDLTKDMQYDSDGVAFVVDGYDEKKKIGYFFADHENLDRHAQAWEPWDPNGLTPAGAWGVTPPLQPKAGETLDELRIPFLPEDLQAKARKALALTAPAKRQAALRAVFREYEETRASDEELESLEERAAETKEYVAIISTWDRRFELSAFHVPPGLSEEWSKAHQITDPVKRDLALRAVQRKRAEKVLAKLETAVREFLDWAESQGQ